MHSSKTKIKCWKCTKTNFKWLWIKFPFFVLCTHYIYICIEVPIYVWMLCWIVECWMLMVILNEKYSFVAHCMSMILFWWGFKREMLFFTVSRITLVMDRIVFNVPQEYILFGIETYNLKVVIPIQFYDSLKSHTEVE